MDLEGIKSACKHFGTHHDVKYNFSSLYDHLGIDITEECYLSHDDSMFGNGKTGFVITNRGFYAREPFSSKTSFVSFETFANADEIWGRGGQFFADGKLIIQAGMLSKDDLEELESFLLAQIKLNAKW